MIHITRFVLSCINIYFHFISILLFIDFSEWSVSLFNITDEKGMCDWVTYSDNFSKNYRNNRNPRFSPELFCLATRKSQKISVCFISFWIHLFMFILYSFYYLQVFILLLSVIIFFKLFVVGWYSIWMLHF